MSNISEEETTDLSIPGYSDVGQHGKKRLKLFVTPKKSIEDSEPTKDGFSPDQTDVILGDLRTFSLDGLKITDCIFRREHVEICYLFQSSGVHNKDELRKQLANHLKINSQLIKLTKLRAEPIYKETSIRPGETVTIDSNGDCKIGAVVEVEGKGNHALMSGHGRSKGDVLHYPNGDLLGVVNISLNNPTRSTANRSYCGYIDVALAKLNEQSGCNGQLLSSDHGPLQLVEQPSEAEEGMDVRCFDAKGNRGTVDSTTYVRRDELNIEWRLISVKDDADGPVHEEGESGILIAEDAPDEGSVKAVGMLVGINELLLDDEEETTRRTSLAAPLTANFEALQRDPYCSGGAIKFLH